MSHIAPSDSESTPPYGLVPRPLAHTSDYQHHESTTPSKPRSRKEENLSEASGGPTVNKDRVKDRYSYKKEAQTLENFENNKPTTTYGATAATATATGAQASGTGSGQVTVRDYHDSGAPLIFSGPPNQMHQQRHQHRGNQNGGGVGAVNDPAPPPADGGGPQPDREPDRDDGRRIKWYKLCVGFASVFVVLLFLAGVVSIVVWLTVVNKQNTEPQVTYANLFEVIPLEHMFRPSTKGGADIKVNLTGRVSTNFEGDKFHLSLYRGSCIVPPNQTLTTSGRAENYRVFGENTFVSTHVLMLGPSAELNVTFVLSNSTLTNGATFKVYFFKSYENLLQCRNSEAAATRTKCPRSFSLPGVSGMSSFSYANGSYGLNVERENLSEKPFEGQHYFLTKFLVTSPGSPSTYDNLFVNFTFRYSTTGVFNPLATGFSGQKCKYLDDTNDKIYEYKCGVDYGSFFTAGRSRCTYLTLATPYIAPEIDSRFRDLFPVTITERHRDDVMIFIAGVVLLAILFVLIASSGLLFKTVRSRCARREYRPLN